MIAKLPSDLQTIHNEAGTNFYELYDEREKLGEGSFASVYECVKKETGKVYAVKKTARAYLKQIYLECTLREVQLTENVSMRG